MNEKIIAIIGAGQMGSRHLQALKTLDMPSIIFVIDPSLESLNIAKNRYDSLPHPNSNNIIYHTDIEIIKQDIDIAIISTNSDTRKKVIESLLKQVNVYAFILEKLLFNIKSHYHEIKNLLEQKKSIAWVNCVFRTMPFYYKIRDYSGIRKYHYNIFGSRFGLVTNSIHYIDYLSFLTGEKKFKLITDFLDNEVIESKRKGFLELNGTLLAQFEGGSVCKISCIKSGDVPLTVEIFNEHFRLISRETENKGWISFKNDGWKWNEIDVDIPYQSQLTTSVVKKILVEGKCDLPTYSESMYMHLQLLGEFREHIVNNAGLSIDLDTYPFT